MNIIKQISVSLAIYLLLISKSYAAPLDDFYSDSELNITAFNGNEKAAATEISAKSVLTNYKASRDVKVVPADSVGSVQAIIPKHQADPVAAGFSSYDANKDGIVSSRDVLTVINHLNSESLRELSRLKSTNPNLDINKDGSVSPVDALAIINCLNSRRRNPNSICGNTAISVYEKPSLIILTDVKGGGRVEVSYGNIQNLNLNIKSKVGDELRIPFSYTSTSNGGKDKVVSIDLYSDDGNRKTECTQTISDLNQISNVYTAEGEMIFKLSSCTGNADLSNVTSMKLTVDAGSQGAVDLRLYGIHGNSFSIGSPEDLSSGVPSTPPPITSPSPSASPSIRPSVSATVSQIPSTPPPTRSPPPSLSPSFSPSASTSPMPTPECPYGGQKDISGTCCPPGQIDSCGICHGSGPDVCGNCGSGPFPPHKAPNKCGECGTSGMNSCGDCVGFPGAKDDKGCGCGSPAPGACGCDPTLIDRGCGCGQPGPSGCAMHCGSTSTFDKCGVCNGDGSSCDCVWAAGWAAESGGKHDGFTLENIYNTLKARINPGTTPRPACFDDWAKTFGCQKILDRATNVSFYGWCKWGNKVSLTAEHAANSFGVPPDQHYHYEARPAQRASKNLAGGAAVYWFLDNNCRYKKVDPSTKICGFTGYSYSPIALLLEDNVNLEYDMRVVEFVLDPKSSSSHALWKGSSIAPLLVYDPEDSNEVTSVTQLLGNYAFGGKTETLENYRRIKDLPWENGYEALALLDTNSDQKILGSELEHLKLWFDYNKNAISETGELKKLSDVGVVSLFYKNKIMTLENSDLRMDVGFEIVKDGKTEVRASIDWYTKSFESKAEAVVALQSTVQGLKGKYSDTDSHTNIDESEFVESKTPRVDPDAPIEENVTGYWVWSLLEKGANAPMGHLIFAQDADNGFLTAKSISETKLSDNDKGLRSAMIAIYGEGKVVKNSAGQTVVNVIFKDSASGGEANSEAVLSEDGNTLRGISTQKYVFKTGMESKGAKVDYKWIATRIKFKE